MLGIEPYQLVSFFRQLGLAVAGASALWGLVFLRLAGRSGGIQDRSRILAETALRLRWPLYAGGLLAIVSWAVLVTMTPVGAHEGVTLTAPMADILRAARTVAPAYLALGLVLLGGLWAWRLEGRQATRAAAVLYACALVTVFSAMSYYTDLRHLPLHEAVFHVFHGFHSVFTLGTVLVLDVIFLQAQRSASAQQTVFPLFPVISKVIWVGFSLDLFSTLLIFPEAVALSARFFFAQTVVGILLMNGVLLSGVITRRILRLLREGEREASAKWRMLIGLSGTVSVTSWTSITLIDFFPGLTLTYPQLMATYASVIGLLFVTHGLWEHWVGRGKTAHLVRGA